MVIHIRRSNIPDREQVPDRALHDLFVIFIRHDMGQDHPYLASQVVFITCRHKQILLRVEQVFFGVPGDLFQCFFITVNIFFSHKFRKSDELLQTVDHFRLTGCVLIEIIGPVHKYRIIFVCNEPAVVVDHL